MVSFDGVKVLFHVISVFVVFLATTMVVKFSFWIMWLSKSYNLSTPWPSLHLWDTCANIIPGNSAKIDLLLTNTSPVEIWFESIQCTNTNDFFMGVHQNDYAVFACEKIIQWLQHVFNQSYLSVSFPFTFKKERSVALSTLAVTTHVPTLIPKIIMGSSQFFFLDNKVEMI